MSGFNDDFLYVPKTPEELLQELTDFYNLQFNLSLTSQEFSNTLEDRAQEYNLQTALQNNVMLGSLYDVLVQYLKNQTTFAWINLISISIWIVVRYIVPIYKTHACYNVIYTYNRTTLWLY